MYLLVFITLVVALIGTYTQVFAVQTARLYANQTTAADAFLTWHSVAVAEARYGGIAAPGAAGCSLTNTPPAGSGIPICTSGGNNATVDGGNPGGITPCPAATNCWTNLPPGYAKNPYTFYSIYYQPAGGGSYVITFVPPPATGVGNPAPGFIALPDGALNSPQIGVTMGNLFSQLKMSNLPPFAYGTINGGQLVTPTISNGIATAAPYALPTLLTGAAYDGSIGIISSP